MFSAKLLSIYSIESIESTREGWKGFSSLPLLLWRQNQYVTRY